jgi:hypothetical protein
LSEVLEVGGVRDIARIREERLAADDRPADVVDVQVGKDDEIDVVRAEAVLLEA